MNTCYVTIVSGNYLAYASVLARSLALHAPTAAFRVMVVDRESTDIVNAALKTGLQITFATELGIPNFERVAYKYDLVELNTGLKPSFLRRIFNDGFERVIYVDPDIQFYNAPTVILKALDNANIVLTPHALQPVMDGLRPSEIDFLRTGSFNLGFIALRASRDTFRMLDWWEQRCLGYGFNDPAFGTFVDQKWIDLVPAFFESVHILRHPGCNVAYWNLHERSITLKHEDGAIMVNGEPLVFFHFSGIKAHNEQLLSKHQTRHQLAAGTILQMLVENYCMALQEAKHEDFSKLGYTFGTLDNGVPITQTMRRALLCSALEEHPFSSESDFQKQLKKAGITPLNGALQNAGANTMNFDQSDRKVIMANFFVRLLAKVIGVDHLVQLIRYGALLSRESHLSSLLLKLPLDFTHRLRR